MTDYKKQYLKYKNKYLKIKKKLGGIGDKRIKPIKQKKIEDAIKKEWPKYAEGEAKAYEQITKNNAKEEEEESIKTPEVNNNITKIATGLTFIGSLIAVLVITLKN